ncbi:MAG TPA: hypothetical protein VGL93_08045 [Streptosporangiaceae bacterium]|jgi:hypothetical protein
MTDNARQTRTLAKAIEAFAGQVYFAPECHEKYAALGFGPSPATRDGVAQPDGVAYMCSRSGQMGQVSGEVVAAAFGVFNPAAVVPAVTHGWTIADPAALCQARTEGAIAQLHRVLGATPDGLDRALDLLRRATGNLAPAGRPMYAAVLAQGLPGDPLGDAWRLADRLREYRGDAHIAAWTSASLDGAEVGLLTELYWGLEPRTYIRSRAWSTDDLDAASDRLATRGLVAEDALTPRGHEIREAIETSTDKACSPIADALGDDADDLITIVRSWSNAIRAAHGYPGSWPVADGK